MSSTPASEAPPSHHEDERLVQALINRGLIARDEAELCKPVPGSTPAGAEALVSRLVGAGFITSSQGQRVIQESAVLVGQQIPGYQLLQKVGKGSMGIVYKARQVSMNRLVAVKVLKPRVASNPKAIERFLHEAHAAAQLSHSNIIQAIDAGSAGSMHYFVMEYVEGTTVAQQLERGKVFKEREALDIILQIARALEHADGRNLVHRDIKPANIVLTSDGTAKLADLGLALQTAGTEAAADEKGLVLGTPYYISPEQIEGKEDIDIRADVYGLGATLFHMVTGQPPFRGEKIDAILEAHLHQELTPPDHLNTSLSSGLGEVVELMMAKDPERRYRDPSELILDLESLIAGEPPKYARQQIRAEMLRKLADGERDDGAVAAVEDERPGIPPLWFAVLAAALCISVLTNVVQLFRR